MIQSFADEVTESFYITGEAPRIGWQHVASIARRKLDQLNGAVLISDLAKPPGNRLELLKGDRAGQYSIRVNDQWRICFVWTDLGPAEVEVTDYH